MKVPAICNSVPKRKFFQNSVSVIYLILANEVWGKYCAQRTGIENVAGHEYSFRPPQMLNSYSKNQI